MRHETVISLLVGFWIFFGFYFVGLSFIAWNCLSSHEPIAFVIEAVWLAWLVAAGVTLILRRAGYCMVVLAVMALWLPMCVQVLRRLHFLMTVGMERADGYGSPLAFVIGLVLEWLIFIPLCGMLAVLLVVRPWQRSVRSGI